jgi:hypothetical protein
MTNKHPITPLPELLDQWCMENNWQTTDIAAQAAQWGADQELEMCCKWIPIATPWDEEQLRAARRPKPPSLNEVALQMLGTIERDAHYLPEITETIRRALEALND